MSYTTWLAQLSAEEQSIYAKPYREPSDFDRLSRIEAARTYLWNVIRVARAGGDVGSVPVVLEVDRAGWRQPTERRRRDRSKPGRPRELPPGCERTTSGRIRAVVYLQSVKVALGLFDPTAAGVELAARVAAAARAAREAGGDKGAVLAAALKEIAHAAD